MAKTKKQEVAIEELPVVEGQVIENVAQPIKAKPVKKDSWEIKDRTYILKGEKEPLTFTIPSKHTRRHPLLWFDTSSNEQRELRYATNMNSPFVDEQKGEVTMGHITFRDGSLHVASKDVALQKLLSLYHPMKDKLYFEEQPEVNAANEIDILEMEIKALNAARNLDIDMAEAVMRVEIGSKVSEMSSKELKRDLLLYAKRNPELFLELVNDENVVLRNFGIRATEMGILKLSSDQRTFSWGSNDRKLMNVPFDEHPYSALAAWFKTDEGMEIYSNIEKRLN